MFRGTVLPVIQKSLVKQAAEYFRIKSFEVPVLQENELYAGKFIACLDRVTPRDLFDVMNFMESRKINKELLDCFCVYLCGTNRPVHEVLINNGSTNEAEFNEYAAGMLFKKYSWNELKGIKKDLSDTILKSLSDDQKEFLVSFLELKPKWEKLPFGRLDTKLPAVKWKLKNLEYLGITNPKKFDEQKDSLVKVFDGPSKQIHRSVKHQL